MLPVTEVHGAVLALIFKREFQKENYGRKKALADANTNFPLVFLLTEFIEGVMFMLVSMPTM